MSTVVARFHQAFIPEGIQHDDVQYHKAKNLLGLLFAAVGAVPPFAALYVMLGHTGAAWAIGLTLPAMALCVVSMRVLGSLWLAQYGAMFSLFALFCYLIWSMGGNPVTSVNAWFASVPLVATFMLGLRQGLLWLGMSILALTGFAAADAFGLGHFPANPVNDPRLLDIISNIGLIPFVAGLALYFQFTKDQSDAIRRSQVSTIEQLMAEVTRLSVQVQGQVEHMVGALDEQSRDAHVLRDASAANEALVMRLQETSTHLVEEAERAHRNAEQGADVVGAAITTTEALATSIGQADALVRALHARSQDISSVVDKIKGLAFQTNILALNATIEAAHAGAQGKGFAVVADNVRRLAGEAGEAASEISRELGVVLDNIGQTAQLLDSSQQQAASGRSSAAMAKEALGVIQSSVLSVHAAMAALQDVSARQSQQNLALKSVAGRLEHGIEQVAQGSGTINRAMSQLTERLHHVAN